MNGASWEMAELMAQLLEDDAWECGASLRAPGRASGREIRPARPIRVRPAARAAGSEWPGARVDVRTDARTFEVAGLFATAASAACCCAINEDCDNAGVCHPHGEAIRPGAHETRAGCEKHAPGGTRSLSSWSNEAC